MKVNETISILLEKVKTLAKTENVVGEPIIAGSTTLIPISKIQVGFVAGGQNGNSKELQKKESDGAGGGISIVPIAVIVIKDGQESRLLWLDKQEKSLNKILDLVPELLEKFNTEKK